MFPRARVSSLRRRLMLVGSLSAQAARSRHSVDAQRQVKISRTITDKAQIKLTNLTLDCETCGEPNVSAFPCHLPERILHSCCALKAEFMIVV